MGVALIAVVGVLLFAIAACGMVFHAKTVARTASEQAALAGARTVLSDSTDGDSADGDQACAVARQAATHNGADLVSCKREGYDVQVVVEVSIGVSFAPKVSTTSRAGPAGCG